MFNINVNEQAEEFRGKFQVLPAGWHKVVIVKAKLKSTTTGGKQLVLRMDNPAGFFDDRLNVVNKNAKAQNIGLSQVAKICQCVGLEGQFTPDDIDKLCGRELDVKVEIEKFKSNNKNHKGEYPMLQSNKSTNYAKAGEKSNLATAVSEESGQQGGEVLW